MGELASYSLIELDRQNDSYSIHPLVQHWSGMTMGTNRRLMQKYVHTIIGLSISWGFKDEDHKYRRKVLQHAVKSTDSFKPEDINTFVATSLELVYWEGGFWKPAEALNMAMMETSKRVLGEEHPDTLMSIANLASTYWSQGRWNNAEVLGVAVMETSKRVLGEEHPETLRRIANLASTYWSQGRWNDAEVLGVAVMETSKRVLGEEHPDTLTRIANLASTYWSQGRWNDAEALEVELMETSKRVLGEEHPDTLTRIANLASTYLNQGRWNDAEALGVAVIETSKRVLGEEHPDTLKRIANLASTYWSQGRWNDAEALGVAVMETSKRVLGEEHPDTLTGIANLALTYRDHGRWNDAEALEVAVVETSKRVLGEEHPDTLTSINNLAWTYQSQGRWDDAEALQVAVVEASKRVLGENHPNTLQFTSNLASIHRNQATGSMQRRSKSWWWKRASKHVLSKLLRPRLHGVGTSLVYLHIAVCPPPCRRPLLTRLRPFYPTSPPLFYYAADPVPPCSSTPTSARATNSYSLLSAPILPLWAWLDTRPPNNALVVHQTAHNLVPRLQDPCSSSASSKALPPPTPMSALWTRLARPPSAGGFTTWPFRPTRGSNGFPCTGLSLYPIAPRRDALFSALAHFRRHRRSQSLRSESDFLINRSPSVSIPSAAMPSCTPFSDTTRPPRSNRPYSPFLPLRSVFAAIYSVCPEI
ncbi:hypothetical protein B0H19DRAFT_1383045 [Mycena capillaripes]|nr:hypothetical protein B0H19DRAFT_1383045 [Mycena capillaripes]